MLDQTALQAKGFIPMNHVAPQFFPVETAKVFDADGKVIPNHQRIFRKDTGDTLGIHRSSYTMVPYERHAQLMEDAIRASTLPLGNMQVATDMAENGAKIFRQYLFPDTAKALKIANAEHQMALRIVTWDSYDGTTAYKARAGSFNFVCANECVHGKMLGNVQFKHTGDLEDRVSKAANDMVASLANFMKEFERYQRWVTVEVTPDTVTNLLKALPQSSKQLTDELTARFARDQGEPSLYNFWQMMTAWSTHDIPIKTRSDRQKRVADLVEGRDWKMVETV